MKRLRIAVAALVVSAAGISTWAVDEGFTSAPVIPTKGDVPTIGHGSTHYEGGTPVKMTDPSITRERGDALARNLMAQDEAQFRASIPGVKLYQEEYDVYVDFVGQYGIGNWRQSSMRRDLVSGRYAQSCADLRKYRFAAGYDCSTLVNGKPNTRCYGVWVRQLKRYNECMGAQ